MPMDALTAFTLAKHEGPYESWPLASRLFLDGADTGADVPGYVVEAQYRVEAGYLLVTSYDCLFEESNDFVLLDAGFQVLARARLMVPYDTFLLHAHWPVPPNVLRLHYSESLFYTLRIVRHRTWWRRAGWRLVLERFEDVAGDAAAQRSLADLQERLAQIRAGSGAGEGAA